jgi:G:T/U-mismatch repair DNA glycosylase
MKTNATLADEASKLADRAAAGSLERRAAGCAAVALRTTRSLDGARRALQTVRDADVRAAAAGLLDQLASNDNQEVPAP